MALEAAFENFSGVHSPIAPPTIGANIDTGAMVPANTIAPTHKNHIVLGAGLIKTITPPWAGFTGTVVLIAGAGSAFTWDATGNIAIASAAAPSVGKAVHFTYVPVTGKWYPSSTVAA